MYHYFFVVKDIHSGAFNLIKGFYVSEKKISQWFTEIDLKADIQKQLQQRELLQLTSELPTITLPDIENTKDDGNIVITSIR